MLVAVRKLYTLSPDVSVFAADLEKIPFSHLAEVAMISAPKAMAPYRAEISRLSERLDFRWSDGWRKLQAEVVAQEIPRVENPIDAFLNVAVVAGLEPWQIDREWAWLHERSLRPDLRITWAKNVARFDRLQTFPELVAAGLLPSDNLGPMPPRGTRIKHAVYPLPVIIETTTIGENKQVQEAAHFVWRCARDLGLWKRGEAPHPRDLFCDTVLDKVRTEQTCIGKQSAQMHIDRIKDWQKSRIDM